MSLFVRIRQFVATQGRMPTDNEVAVLVRDTRPDKLHEMSTEGVRRLQFERIAPHEHAKLVDLCELALDRPQTVALERTLPTESRKHAEEHLPPGLPKMHVG